MNKENPDVQSTTLKQSYPGSISIFLDCNDVNKEESFPDKVKIFKIQFSNRKNVWTLEDDKKLKRLIAKFGARDWGNIARFFTNKTASNCSSRYRRIKKGIKKFPWTAEEDSKLIDLINHHGKNWKLLSNFMINRTGKQIRERYINILDPGLIHKNFEESEDSLIFLLQKIFGNKWKQISNYFYRRNGDMIKNRYYTYIKTNVDEDNYIKNCIEKILESNDIKLNNFKKNLNCNDIKSEYSFGDVEIINEKLKILKYNLESNEQSKNITYKFSFKNPKNTPYNSQEENEYILTNSETLDKNIKRLTFASQGNSINDEEYNDNNIINNFKTRNNSQLKCTNKKNLIISYNCNEYDKKIEIESKMNSIKLNLQIKKNGPVEAEKYDIFNFHHLNYLARGENNYDVGHSRNFFLDLFFKNNTKNENKFLFKKRERNINEDKIKTNNKITADMVEILPFEEENYDKSLSQIKNKHFIKALEKSKQIKINNFSKSFSQNEKMTQINFSQQVCKENIDASNKLNQQNARPIVLGDFFCYKFIIQSLMDSNEKIKKNGLYKNFLIHQTIKMIYLKNALQKAFDDILACLESGL